MAQLKIYEPRRDPCELCKEQQGVLLPFCRDGERTFFFLVCLGCRDKVPYEVIPIKITLGEGFFYCPNIPENFDPSRVVIDDTRDFDPKKPIFTRYSKKVLLNRARKNGVDSLSAEEKQLLRSNGVDFIVMEDGTNAHL